MDFEGSGSSGSEDSDDFHPVLRVLCQAHPLARRILVSVVFSLCVRSLLACGNWIRPTPSVTQATTVFSTLLLTS